jgi:predicted HTH transcriptional regulator
MPYLSEKKKLPLSLDRRVKLSVEDRKKILSLKGTMSQRQCAEMFNISRSTIQYLWNPERLIKIKE